MYLRKLIASAGHFAVTVVPLLLMTAEVSLGHPMGNFSLNHNIILDLVSDQVLVHALTDYAEVPSFEQFSAIDLDVDRVVTPQEMDQHLDQLVPEIVANYDLKLDGKRTEPELMDYKPRLSQGVMRVTCIQILASLKADLPTSVTQIAIQFENHAYQDRAGNSYIRVRWSPEWRLSAIESIPSRGIRPVEAVVDFDDSFLLPNTRTVRFVARRVPAAPDDHHQPLRPAFASVDRFLPFELIPVEVLCPDAKGRYEIFHVKLAREFAPNNPVAAARPRVVEALPALPPSMRAPAQSTGILSGDVSGGTNSGRPESIETVSQGAPALDQRLLSVFGRVTDLWPAAFLVLAVLSGVYWAARRMSRSRRVRLW